MTFTDEQSKQIKETYDPNAKAIIATIDASHGGYINRNFYYYNPDSMRSGTPTWTKPYAKPWILNHYRDSDPVGRVQQARFFGDSNQGHVQTAVRITDMDAIERVVDGRYLTVSVGQKATQSVTCSICGTDLMSSDRWCGHIRGVYYDPEETNDALHNYKPAERDANQTLCYWIVDGIEYIEGSFVNVPADNDGKEFAGVVEWETTDSLQLPEQETIDQSSAFQDPNAPAGTRAWIMSDSHLWIPRGQEMLQLQTDWQGRDDIPDQVANPELWASLVTDRDQRKQDTTADALLPLYLDQGGHLCDTTRSVNLTPGDTAPEPNLSDGLSEILPTFLTKVRTFQDIAEAGDLSDGTAQEPTSETPVVSTVTELKALLDSPEAVVAALRAFGQIDIADRQVAHELTTLLIDQAKTQNLAVDEDEVHEIIHTFDLLEGLSDYMRGVQYPV